MYGTPVLDERVVSADGCCLCPVFRFTLHEYKHRERWYNDWWNLLSYVGIWTCKMIAINCKKVLLKCSSSVCWGNFVLRCNIYHCRRTAYLRERTTRTISGERRKVWDMHGTLPSAEMLRWCPRKIWFEQGYHIPHSQHLPHYATEHFPSTTYFSIRWYFWPVLSPDLTVLDELKARVFTDTSNNFLGTEDKSSWRDSRYFPTKCTESVVLPTSSVEKKKLLI
jgi:hypothetical protein